MAKLRRRRRMTDSILRHSAVTSTCSREAGAGGVAAHFGREAGAAPGALRDAALDDLGLRHQHIHQVAAVHQVEQEVKMVLVLD